MRAPWILALVVTFVACGDADPADPADPAEATEAPAAPEPATPAPSAGPEPEPEPEPEQTPEPDPTVELPPLDSRDSIRAALLAARPSTAALWSLADPDRGLDLDFHNVATHFAHTACSEDDLSAWLEWARQDGHSFYRLTDADPFHCTEDLSLCASCPEDISTCERGSVFELAGGRRRPRRLYGVIMAPARSEALWDLTPTTLEGARRARVDLGAATETGVKCAIRNRLSSGELESVWVERVPETGEREARRLEGEEARDFGRDLGGRFGLMAYCDAERCVVPGDGNDVYGVYYRRRRRRRRRPPPPPRVTLVTAGPPGCDGCAPEPSAEVRRRARRGRRRR